MCNIQQIMRERGEERVSGKGKSSCWVVLVVLFTVGCSTSAPPAGIYVRDGVPMRSGEPYRAMGINYHNCFSLVLADETNRDFVEGFRILKEDYSIPFIRFMAGPYAHQGWRLYLDNPDDYFRRMDLIVREAEKQELGLIPSLFWYVVSVPDLMNEPVSELGNRESASREFMRRYTRDVVSRYKDSPAIWGWEVGNEWMLAVDLPQLNHLPRPKIGTDQPRTAADKLLRPMILDVYEEFHRTVRELDLHRMIVTGDSIARAQAWHNRHEDSWGQDTRKQWFELFSKETPDCYETVSFHMYAEMDGKYFEGENVPLERLVRDIVVFCRQEKKAIWCGELGMPGTDESAQDLFWRMMRIVEEYEIELSAIWNFIPDGVYQSDWDITPKNDRAYMLDAVKTLNERFAIGEWK